MYYLFVFLLAAPLVGGSPAEISRTKPKPCSSLSSKVVKLIATSVLCGATAWYLSGFCCYPYHSGYWSESFKRNNVEFKIVGRDKNGYPIYQSTTSFRKPTIFQEKETLHYSGTCYEFQTGRTNVVEEYWAKYKREIQEDGSIIYKEATGKIPNQAGKKVALACMSLLVVPVIVGIIDQDFKDKFFGKPFKRIPYRRP